MGTKDNTTRTQEDAILEKLGIPLDYVPRTRKEFILQQSYIRDSANDEIVKMIRHSGGKLETRGLLALYELVSRTDAAIEREREVCGSLDENRIRRVEITLVSGNETADVSD